MLEVNLNLEVNLDLTLPFTLYLLRSDVKEAVSLVLMDHDGGSG